MRKSSSVARSRFRAFTLLELLVVIAIIGILAGLMYPAIHAALKHAEKTHAQNTTFHLRNAVSAYFTDYRKYPVRASSGEEGAPLRSGHDLMDALLASDAEKETGGLNPRGTVYYTDKIANPMGDGKFRKGIKYKSGGGGELWDPWGELFFVAMDLDYNDRTELPEWAEADTESLPEGILIWSGGPDKDESTPKDNVKTW